MHPDLRTPRRSRPRKSSPRPAGRGASPNPRPRDAASLLLVRRRGRGVEVLLGRRPPRDRFVPDVWVFPGGRVDAGDASQAAVRELKPDVASQLQAHASAPRARALAIAAVRETFEETGLVLGEGGRGRPLRPDLGSLSYVARAITPAGNPIRYHARFFLTDGASARGTLRGNGELLDLRWMRFSDVFELPLMDVTRHVLGEAERRLRGDVPRAPLLVSYRLGAVHTRRG